MSGCAALLAGRTMPAPAHQPHAIERRWEDRQVPATVPCRTRNDDAVDVQLARDARDPQGRTVWPVRRPRAGHRTKSHAQRATRRGVAQIEDAEIHVEGADPPWIVRRDDGALRRMPP